MTMISLLLDGLMTLLLAGAGVDPSVVETPTSDVTCDPGASYDSITVNASYANSSWSVTAQASDGDTAVGAVCDCVNGCTITRAPTKAFTPVYQDSGNGVIYFGYTTNTVSIQTPPAGTVDVCDTIDFGAAVIDTDTQDVVALGDPKITIDTGVCDDSVRRP